MAKTEPGKFEKDFDDIINKGYLKKAREGEVTKTSFAPSGLGYASGACPRRWVLAFRGTEAQNVTDVTGFIMMEVGTDRHEKLQAILKEDKEFVKEIEYELFNDDPPVHGFIDGILEYEGEPVILEIKTCRSESFYSRKITGRAPDYHMIQLLLYMYIMKIDRGVFLYENKNDGQRLFIKVAMNDYNKNRIEEVLDWMREVYDVFKRGDLPKRPYKPRSVICKKCIFKPTCFELDESKENLISIDPLPKVFE